MRKHFLFIISLLAIISFIGIGAGITGMGGSMDEKMANAANNPLKQEDRLNPQDKDHGIGPVKNVELGPLDKKMADDGNKIFSNKCFICHELDQKKIGPPLRNITKDRTPEYIMNLLVNTVQMQKEDPIVKDLFKKYNNIPMPDPAINQTQARSVLEYLRSVVK